MRDFDDDFEIVDVQVKLFGQTLEEFWPGHQMPAVEGLEPPYSVAGMDGEMFVNVAADGTYTGLTRTPAHRRVVSKWGGPPDEVNPVVAALVAEGLIDPDDV